MNLIEVSSIINIENSNTLDIDQSTNHIGNTDENLWNPRSTFTGNGTRTQDYFELYDQANTMKYSLATGSSPPKINNSTAVDLDQIQINRVPSMVQSELRTSSLTSSGRVSVHQNPLFDSVIPENARNCLRSVLKTTVSKIPWKRFSKGLFTYMTDLALNDPFTMPANIISKKFKLFSVEQEDLLNIEEVPTFNSSPYYEGFVEMMRSTNEDQKIVNLDLFSTIMKASTVNSSLKESLFSCPVPSSKTNTSGFPSLIDMMLYDTLNVRSSHF